MEQCGRRDLHQQYHAILEVSSMHFRGTLSRYTKTMNNCIHQSSYVIM